MSRACPEFCLSSIARLGLGRKPRTGATHAVVSGRPPGCCWAQWRNPEMNQRSPTGGWTQATTGQQGNREHSAVGSTQ